MASVSHSLPSLEITAAPDDMEITSELGIFDYHSDIDLDLPEEAQGDPDGDFILEDVASEAGKAPSLQDQEMNQEEITYGEEDVSFEDAVVEDGGVVFDEDLTDVNIEGPSGDDIGHMNENAKIQGQPDYTLEASVEGFEAAEEEYPHLPQDASHISLEHAVHHEAHQSGAIVDQSEGVQVHDFPTTEHSGNPDYADGAGEMTAPYQAVEFAAEHTDEAPHNTAHSASPHLELKPEAQDATDTTQTDSGHAAPADHTSIDDEAVLSATGASQLEQEPPAQDAPGESEVEHNPNDHFHSTIAVYEGEEIYLFQSREEERPDACLLQDASLVSRSIYDLLQACRGALGESIPEEQELQIEVHDLDLIIGEESAHALSTSFSEILDVYLSLYSLDGVDQPQPLYVTISTKKKFSARLGLLRAAVADGFGMSQLYWYGRADEEYSDEQADHTGEGQGAAEVTEQSLEGEAASLAEPSENVYATGSQDAVAEHSTEAAAAEQDAGVSINADAHLGYDLLPESEMDKPDETQGVLATADDETGHAQGDYSTGDSTVRTAQQATEENPSGENTAYDNSDRPTKAGGNAAGDDGLIDYGDQDEHHSTGSSTIVGDGSNAHDDAKVQAASEPAPDATSAEDQGAWVMEPHEQGEAHEELEFHYEGGNQEGYQEGYRGENQEEIQEEIQENQENQEEYQSENLEQFALDGDFTAQVGENEFNYGIGEVEDGAHPQDQTYEGGDDHFDDGTRFNTDEISWEDPLVDNTNSEQHAAVDVPHGNSADQEESWDDFLETEQPLDNDETQPIGEKTSEPTSNVQSQFAASAETLVGGANNVDPLEQADQVTFDDFDEITYGEEDEDAAGLQAESEQPNESPPGKRSLTEHLEGDHDDDSETAAKRLRSI